MAPMIAATAASWRRLPVADLCCLGARSTGPLDPVWQDLADSCLPHGVDRFIVELDVLYAVRHILIDTRVDVEESGIGIVT